MHSPASLKTMHMTSVEVDGEGSWWGTSCYDSVVKYLLQSCRGSSMRAQTKKTAKKWPKLHSSPLRGLEEGFKKVSGNSLHP